MQRNSRREFRYSLVLLPVLVFALGMGSRASAQQYRSVLDLRGEWRFEIGDNMKWADPSFNDAGWARIHVPGPWEEQGFPGYDGYAWYRKTVSIPQEWGKKQLYLDLGTVDDVDEVYVNGFFIGFRGQFPPEYVSAYNHQRFYFLPEYCLRPGKANVIAVRVYDSEMGGGIYRGDIAIKEMTHPVILDQQLPSTWKFEVGDNMDWRSPQFDDTRWENIAVPAFWETQGHKEYNGYGWYRVKFKLNPGLKGQRLILFLGKIDDIDETYLNGDRIGKTGQKFNANGPEFSRWRAYTIPGDKIYTDRENVIAVRVYDGFMHGGIYVGPIGIMTRENYLEWEPYQGRQTGKKVWENWMEWLFN
jgi:beta-galactosidase/beta-glucuronidase